MSYQVKFGEKYLELFENGEVEILEKEIPNEISEIKYQENCQIQLIQFTESSKKVLIKLGDSKFNVYDFETKNVSPLKINNNLVNIFWSQIEDDYIITAYKDEINLIDSKNNILKSFNINNLTKCKNCQNDSILCRFSLISLIGNEALCLITPFVSNHFKLDERSYEKLKEALQNENSKYFDEIFTQRKNDDKDDEMVNGKKKNRNDYFYEFNSLFGLDINATCYPLNIKNGGRIIDFSMKNNYIFVLFENNVIKRLSLSFPSFFDYQRIINTKCHTLPNIEVTQFISIGPQLFGLGYSKSDKKYGLFQFFDECVARSNFDNEIIGLIKSKKNENGLKEFILLFSDNSIKKIEDESVYYESHLNERLKYLQQRRQYVLKKKLNLEKQINQFRSEMSKLVPLQKVQSLLDRVEKLKNMNIHSDENKNFDVNQIEKEIPNITKNIKILYQKHNKIIANQNKEIEQLKSLVFQ